MQPQSLILILVLGGLLFVMFNSSRRRQRDAQNLRAGVAVGTKIMTTAGLFATVVEIDDGVVTLETAPGQRSRWDRRAIAKIVADEPAPEAGEAPTTAEDVDGPGGDLEHETDAAPPDRA